MAGGWVRDFTDYLVLVMLTTGHYHMKHLKARETVGILKSFTHNGHRYDFDTEYAHHLHGWFPWLKDQWSNPFSILIYILRTGYLKVGLLVYREPEDKLHGVEIPIPPMHISADAPGSDDSKRIGNYQTVTPMLFRGILTNPLYRNYQRKLRFAGNTPIKVLFYIAIISVVILVALYMTGVMGA